MYRNLRSLFELTRDESVDEDQILVETFFRQLGRHIPLWLAPRFLEMVAGEAYLKDFRINPRIAGCVDPNGGPWWG